MEQPTRTPPEFSFRTDPPRPGRAYVESFLSIVVLYKVQLNAQGFTRARPCGRIGAAFHVDKDHPLASKPGFLGYNWWVDGIAHYGVPSRHQHEVFTTLEEATADCQRYLNTLRLYPEFPDIG